MIDIKHILCERGVMLSTIDQLESFLYDQIEDIIHIVEDHSVDELIEKYGVLESSMIVYCYAILVDKTCNDVINKLHNNQNDINNTPD